MHTSARPRPGALLHEIRSAQEGLVHFGLNNASSKAASVNEDLHTFLRGLATRFKEGEVRPTHRIKARTQHWWRTRVDSFEHAWPMIEQWLQAEPSVTTKELMGRLNFLLPDVYAGNAQLRTLQRRVKAWRGQLAKGLVFRRIETSKVSGRIARGDGCLKIDKCFGRWIYG